MRAVLHIALADLRRMLRERQNLFWLFVAPLLFSLFFGLLLQPPKPRATALTIVDGDRPPGAHETEGAPSSDAPRVADMLARLLSADSVDVRTSAIEPKTGFALVLPAGTSAALAANRPVQLTLKAGAEQTEQERRLQFKIQKAVVQVALGGSPPAGARPVAGPIEIVQSSLDVRAHPRAFGFQHAVPAYLVMFVFMNLLVSGAGIAEERATGRLRRLALAPISFRQIVSAKLLSRFATGWLQMAYMLLVGGLLFGVSWGANPLLLCGFLSVFALAAAALGLLIGTLFADADKCATFAVWFVMILSPLGGLWWPLEIVGPTLRKVAYVVPTGWAMQAVGSMMAFGAGPLDVAPYAVAFLGLFVASFLLATRRLRAQVLR